MTAPTSYTEDQLKGFMHRTLGAVASVLNWDVFTNAYDEAAIETLLAYGVDTIAEATDMRKLRALARREVWRAVMHETVGDFDFSADGGSYNRSQIHAQAVTQFSRAADDALEYDDINWRVSVATLTQEYDPYAPPED